jgi:hypothetical protein
MTAKGRRAWPSGTGTEDLLWGIVEADDGRPRTSSVSLTNLLDSQLGDLNLDPALIPTRCSKKRTSRSWVTLAKKFLHAGSIPK